MKNILRIRSPNGQYKLELESDVTFDTLQKEIQKLTLLPPQSQTILLDDGRGKPTNQAIKCSNQTRISELGMTHGSMLHVQDSSLNKQIAEEESRKACTLDLKKHAKEKEEKLKEEQKIRAAMFETRSGWGQNTVVFKRSDKLRLIKSQKERICVQAQITSASVKILVNKVVESFFTTHRCAFIYGTFKKRKEQVSVVRWREVALKDEMVQTTKMRMETMWEPPQIGNEEGVIVDDQSPEHAKMIAQADEMASYLGLQCVGLIMTVPVQNARTGEVRLRSRDLVQAAKYQAKYGAGFTTLIVPVGQQEDGTSWSGCEAWQVTESCVQLCKQGDFEDNQTHDDYLLLKDVAIVYREQEDKSVKEVETMKVEVEMFQKKIPIQLHKTKFMRPSIFTEEKGTLADYLVQHAQLPWQKKLADFNLLMYLSNGCLDHQTDMPLVCEAIKQQNEIQEGFVMLINSLAGNST